VRISSSFVYFLLLIALIPHSFKGNYDRGKGGEKKRKVLGILLGKAIVSETYFTS